MGAGGVFGGLVLHDLFKWIWGKRPQIGKVDLDVDGRDWLEMEADSQRQWVEHWHKMMAQVREVGQQRGADEATIEKFLAPYLVKLRQAEAKLEATEAKLERLASGTRHQPVSQVNSQPVASSDISWDDN